MNSLRLDLFCQVIDNFGDAGVCWRLARQLAEEKQCRVTLWIDKLPVLHKINSSVNPDWARQTVAGVEISLWPETFVVLPDEAIPDAVVEGFGSRLPEIYVQQMLQKQRPPVWINLEYLSAESWIEEIHQMASPQSSIPLTKYFYFPGFSTRSGGLIQEKDLIERRIQFQANPQNAKIFLSGLGVQTKPEQFIVSLFCYPNAPVLSLLKGFQNHTGEVLCLIPEGVASEVISSFMGKPAIAGSQYQTGNLSIQILSMVDQNDYDCLLWSCDLNFVRGEDSFVRAQWAARPFVWHVYPQEANIHLQKLDTFLQLFMTGLGEPEAEIVRQFWNTWNGNLNSEINSTNWTDFWEIVPELKRYGNDWAKKIADNDDLASGLLRFINSLR